MRKNNKGFTLIELLAIIVILAIIAVITVPIILNVIDNAKRGTAKDSAYGYKDAINKYYVSSMLEDESIKLDGEYNVVDGKLGEHDIPFSGTKPTSGYLSFENNKLTEGCLTIDEYKIVFENGEVTTSDVGECSQKQYKCKRATVLHTEECARTKGGCFDVGYTTDGEKKTTTVTYGNLKTSNDLKSGDAFDCDVNGDGIYDSDTERFYYVSDIYDTNTKQFNDKYAALIYYNNTTTGQGGTDSYEVIYEEGTGYVSEFKFGNNINPFLNYLATSSEWNNVSLFSLNRNVLNEKGEGTSRNGTIMLQTSVSYTREVDGENVPLAARLLTYQEVDKACNIGDNRSTKGVLDLCSYLFENTDYALTYESVHYYPAETIWLETAASFKSISRFYIYSYNRNIGTYTYEPGPSAIRPVIEVKKTDIEI